MDELLKRIRACRVCDAHLLHGCKPVLRTSAGSRIVIVGQAPGAKVHASGVPWDDQSGRVLRKWMGVDDETFYNERLFAIVPMGFCYPGKGRSGDLPPREECAPLWHTPLLNEMRKVETILLIGQYAQRYYLGDRVKSNLTETVRNYDQYLPRFMVLPHPSPRNRFWMAKNPWFESDVLPLFKSSIQRIIEKSDRIPFC